MFNLMIILLGMINSETKDSNNYKIAKYIVENINDLEHWTITDLAQACFVSNSSVSRFCRDIGLRDFMDLKSQVSKFQVLQDDASAKFDYDNYQPNNTIGSYIDEIIMQLERLKESLDEDALHRLVKDIASFKNVAAFGYMQSENVALSLQYDLQTSRKIIYTCMQYAKQIEYISDAKEDSLIIIISSSGSYFKRAYDRQQPFKHKEHKPKIWMITTNRHLNIPYVDEYLIFDNGHDYASHPYSLQAISSLISLYYHQLGHQS